jgi:hypothetical protein
MDSRKKAIDRSLPIAFGSCRTRFIGLSARGACLACEAVVSKAERRRRAAFKLRSWVCEETGLANRAPTKFGLCITVILAHHGLASEARSTARVTAGPLRRAHTPIRRHAVYCVPGYSFTKSRLLDSSNAVNTGLAPGSEAGCMGHDPLVAKVRSHSA